MPARLLAATALVALAASTADAQIVRQRRVPTPRAYMAASVGIFMPQSVNDGSTQSTWQFGDALQYRLTWEQPVAGTAGSFGLAGTLARVPLTYYAGIGATDADAQVAQVFATFHSGGAQLGFHQVLDLEVGTTIYSNFRRTSDGQKIGPKSDADLTLNLGYGFGFAMSPSFRIELVQQYGLAMHQRTGLSGGEGTTSTQRATRVGVRLGLGAR